MRLSGILAMCLIAATLVGCGDRADTMYSVKGTLKVNGVAVDDGAVHFATEGRAPVILPVVNGAFSGQVTAGPKRVQLFAYKQVELKVKPTGPGAENAQAPKENILSDAIETREVKASQTNEFDFEGKLK